MKTISLLCRIVCAVLLFTLFAPFTHAQNGFLFDYKINAPYLIVSPSYLNNALGIDSRGNLYAAVTSDSNGHIFKLSNTGTLIGSILDSDNQGLIYNPQTIAVDSAGNIYTTDINRLAEFSSTGVFIRQIEDMSVGLPFWPDSAALDSQGNIFVADGSRIEKFSNNGTYIGLLSNSAYYSPLAVDNMGNVFFGDSSYNIVKLNNIGNYLMGITVGYRIKGIAVDSLGNIFAMTGNEILEFNSNGNQLTGIVLSYYPDGVTVDKDGKVFSLNSDAGFIDVFTPAPSIASITTNATNPVVATDTFQATVTLDRPAPVDLDVQITARYSVLSAPPTVHFPAGQTTAMLTVNTNLIGSTKTDTLTATLNRSSKSANVTVRPLKVLSITFPASAQADMVIPGTLKLEKPLPRGTTLYVTLNSSNYSAAYPYSNGTYSTYVVGPSDTANAAVLTRDVTANTNVTFTAKASAEDAGMSATMNVTPFEPILYYSIAPTRDRTSGDIVLTIQITDFGPAPTTNYTVTSATLNTIGTSTTLPTAPLTFAAHGSATVVLHFPGSVGAAGQTVPFVMKATYGNSTAYVTTTNTLNANVTLPSTQLTGTIRFTGLVAYAAAQNVTFTFRPNDNSGNITRTLALPPGGAYTLGGLPAKAGVLHIKPEHFLAANIAIDLSAGNVTGANVTVPPCDANNDNSIDLLDFGLFVDAFGSDTSVPGTGYDIRADFNGDGLVDLIDFGLLTNGFGLSGAP